MAGREVLLARTGYTGEDGFELFSRPEDAEHIWTALSEAGAATGLVPAGLAARDTLRLEAGMPLYGNELGPDTTPVRRRPRPGGQAGQAGRLRRPGRARRARPQAPPRQVLVGLRSGTRRVPRHGYPVLWDGQPRGTVTSGAPSPTLGEPIAMAYVEPEVAAAAGPGTLSAATGPGGRPARGRHQGPRRASR